MDKEKTKALSETLERCKELQENNNVNLIEFHTADGQYISGPGEDFRILFANQSIF